jgi:hypothetical protein
MLARCLRDKIPKGDYIIRASVLDRLTNNKMYYKIIEYGERFKEYKIVEKEKIKRQAEEEANKLVEQEMAQAFEDQNSRPDSKEQSNSEDISIREEDDEFKVNINKPLFEPGDDLSDDSSDGSDEDGDKKKVKWDAAVVDKSRMSVKNRQATMI